MGVKEEIFKILPKPPAKVKFAHIITASKPEKNIDYMLIEKKAMIEAGLRVKDIDIEGKTEDQLRQIFKDMDVLYIQGGNPFYLLKHVKKSGFDKVVREFINQGKVYIGVSAGSYIACPTIEQALWKNPKRNRFGLTNLTAMNLVPFLISAHFEVKYHSLLERAAKTTKYPIVALTDKQAVLVEGKKWRIVGKGKKSNF